jgi:hypothetical protein
MCHRGVNGSRKESNKIVIRSVVWAHLAHVNCWWVLQRRSFVASIGCSPHCLFPISKHCRLRPTSCQSWCNDGKPRKESRLRLKRFADPPPHYPLILPPPLLHRRRSSRTGLPISSHHPTTPMAQSLTWMTLASRSASQAGTPTPTTSVPRPLAFAPPTPKYILFLSLTSVRGRGLFCRVWFGLGCPDEVICFGMVVLNTYEVCANLQMNFGDRCACKIEADGGIRPPPCSMTFVALLHWWFNHHSYKLMLMLYCVMYHKALDIVLCTRIIICCVTMKEVLCKQRCVVIFCYVLSLLSRLCNE